jgi:hypothetical protein
MIITASRITRFYRQPEPLYSLLEKEDIMAPLANPHRKAKISEKQMALRAQLWPDIPEDGVWNRKQKVGYTTIPRTLPFVMRIMDAMSNRQPVSATYLDLWCRAHDEAFLSLANRQQEMAYASGFGGQRAVQTWSQRIDILSDLGFIRLAAGPKSYALILNPFFVLRKIRAKKASSISAEDWNALAARLIEIGSDDLTDPATKVAAKSS